MEPAAFNHHEPDHSGPSSRVASPSDLRPLCSYGVRNLELIEDGLYKVEVRCHREEIVANFFVD
jgi:hypothetical protein